MFSRFSLGYFSVVAFFAFATLPSSPAQDSKIMGELRFEGASNVDRDAGIWVDGNYVGYVKELKDGKKVLLLPGKHHLVAREAGYSDWSTDLVVEPHQVQTLSVTMTLLPGAHDPAVTSELKLTIQPSRAAVFLDEKYVGHAGELGGHVHSLLLPPGRHHIKVELAGYRTFETDLNLIAGQKSEVKTELAKGSIEDASPDIKQNPQLL